MKNFTFFCILSIITVLLGISLVHAQDFSVLASKGKAEYKKAGSGSWTKVQAGAKLSLKDRIKISANSYLGLAHKSGRTIELSNAGEYTVKQLDDMVASKKNDVSGRLVKYVVGQIQESDNIMSAGDYRNNMTTTGAVERGGAGLFSFRNSEKSIVSLFPLKTNLVTKTIGISWNKNKEIKEYKFNLKDRFDRIVYTRDLKDTSIFINSETLKLNREEYYFWSISSAADSNISSETGCFQIFSDSKIKMLNDSLTIIKDEIKDENSALGKIIIASFFEENNLLNEASIAYKEAINLKPGVQEFEWLYIDFLKRTEKTTAGKTEE